MTEPEINKTAELLSQLEPGFVPYPIFEQFMRILAMPILEIIPLRQHNGQTQVLLIERDADDPLWPGATHTPGTVIRATDYHESGPNSWQALERIKHDELKDTPVGSPQYVGSMLHKSKRGVEQAQLYWVEVLGEPTTGAFYAVNALPNNLIESQCEFIRVAAEQFELKAVGS